jgi:hypothetical protein
MRDDSAEKGTGFKLIDQGAVQFSPMKRVRRWLFDALAWMWPALCVAIVLLWVRSLYSNDEIDLNVNSHLLMAGSFPNHADIRFYRTTDYDGPRFRVSFGKPQIGPMPIFWQPRLGADATKRELAIPWWLLLIFSGSIPLWAAHAAIRRQSRLRRGCCAECGYDLRSSPDRCPECGTIPARKKSALE